MIPASRYVAISSASPPSSAVGFSRPPFLTNLMRAATDGKLRLTTDGQLRLLII
jgi:hypothetical protein